MRYDTVIIGGGLSALLCGIELVRNGKRAAIVTTGHSSLHFSSGSFGLYNGAEPLKAVEALGENHPYTKLGEDIEQLAAKATEILNIAGVATVGDAAANHYIMTPTGAMRQCWLSVEGMVTSNNGTSLDFSDALILCPEGFLDFYTQFVADSLSKLGVKCKQSVFSLPELTIRRNNPTEMRSVTVARALDKEENILALASIITAEAKDTQTVIMPAVLGFERTDVLARLEKITGKQILTVATLPPSVEGIKVERALRKTFERMGGVIFNGHTATQYTMEEGAVATITTSKGVTLTANDFVLASGSFIGGGLQALRSGVTEVLFGADVVAPAVTELTNRNLLESQPFMSAGIATDPQFKVLVAGQAVENLYGCGAILADYNPVKEGCGAGVAMLSALKVADDIINR